MKLKRILYWSPPSLWTIFIFIVGSLNFNDEFDQGNFLKRLFFNLKKFFIAKEGIFYKIVALNLDKIYHFLQYLILATLVFWAAKKDLKKSFSFNIRLTFLAVFLIGMFDELHQIFLKNRGCSLFDLFANISGVLLLYMILKDRKMRTDGI
ncbi:MAG: VanZ family protein [candidate division WOR-3 bacterium]